VTAGSADLLRETLKFDGEKTILVDVRVAPKTSPATATPGFVRVTGKVLDASGVLSSAVRVQMCCIGPVQRLSAPVQSDGSFEFAALPPGASVLELQARPGMAVPVVSQYKVLIGNGRVIIEVVTTAGPTGTQRPMVVEIPKDGWMKP
jgi:hypothetical protein